MATGTYYLRPNVFMIGDLNCQIIGNKLPSKKHVLHVLFFNLLILKQKLQESVKLLSAEVTLIWDKTGIPQQTFYKCNEKSRCYTMNIGLSKKENDYHLI